MEQSATRSRFVRVLLKIARFVGIYLLSFGIVYFLGRKGVFANGHFDPALFFLLIVLVLPLVWALSKNFFAGFIKYAVLIGVVLVIDNVWPEGGLSTVSGDSFQNSGDYTGRYSGNDNGIDVEIVVGQDRWYGEVIEGTTGSLISNEAGEVTNGSLYDQYGTEIGEINGSVLKVSIQGQRIRLKKN
ncbi:MAG: hypothetical protein JNM22_22385 [Saprospiraceae bacterium]|nr:hypothetical protein [Saprospiraceae bacterium]